MTEAGDGDMGERLTAAYQDRQVPGGVGRAKTGLRAVGEDNLSALAGDKTSKRLGCHAFRRRPLWVSPAMIKLGTSPEAGVQGVPDGTAKLKVDMRKVSADTNLCSKTGITNRRFGSWFASTRPS